KNPTATNDKPKKHRKHGTTSIGLVGVGKTDTIEDDFPDSADKAAAKRNDEERISRTACEADDAKGRFERLLRTADNHQAEMENRGGNEGFDGDEKWNENNKEHWPDPAAHHLHHRDIAAAKPVGRAHPKVITQINHPAYAAAH